MALARQEAEDGVAGEGLSPLVLFAAIEACPVNITIADLSRRDAPLFFVNRAFCDTTGYAREEVIGRNCRFLQGEGTDEEAVAQMRRAIADRRPLTVELVNYRRCGMAFLNRVELAPVRDPARGIDACIGIQRDITAFRAQEASRQQREKLEAIGRLASGLAHELNNLLQPIVLNAALLAEGRLGAEDQREEALADMLGCARAARALTGRVLQFARRSAEEARAEPASQRLGEAVRVASALLPPGVRLVLRGLEGLEGPCPVALGELVQVFGNLFKNAAEAMAGDGMIEVEAVDDGEAVRVRVTDSGPGIDPACAARVFEPFFTTKPPGEGTGLGLACVWGLVRGWGGSIVLDTKPGPGASFVVTIPVRAIDPVHGGP